MDRPPTASSTGSSKQTSSSAQKTSASSRTTDPSSISSAPSSTTQKRDAFLASTAESLRVEGSSRQQDPSRVHEPREPQERPEPQEPPPLQEASRIEEITQESPRSRPTTRSMTGAIERRNLEISVSPSRSPKRRRRRRSPSPSTGNSPWDPTPRKEVKVEDLDLDKSYVGLVQPPSGPKKPRRQKRWKHHGDEPLTDWRQLPKGWNSKEPDLEVDDIDGQIARCHERIEDNIMPFIFRQRLKEYEETKAERDAMASRYPDGLSWDVVQRLDTLEGILGHLRESGDEFDQSANVEALIKAYRSGQLEWTGLVTYWSKGVQLCQPRPFDWDEFEAINRKHKGSSAFWVEGTHGPGPSQSNGSVKIDTMAYGAAVTQYFTALRLPGYDYYNELLTVFDTGATDMLIFRDDLETIAGPRRPPGAPEIFVMGEVRTHLANGSTVDYPFIMVEATLTDNKGRRISNWIRTPANLMPGAFRPGQNCRLDGQWVRRSLYTGSAPAHTYKIIHYAAATERHQMRLPHVHQDERPLPDLPLPIRFQPGRKVVLKDHPAWLKQTLPRGMPEPAAGVRG